MGESLMAERRKQMIIKREINGETRTFELTDKELWDAYCEQERHSAYADLDIYMDERFENEEDAESWGFEERPEVDDDDRDEIVELYLRDKDNNWEEKMDTAFRWVMGEA